jgi:hypothetical protein
MKTTKKAPAMPKMPEMPVRRGTSEYRDAQRAEFDKRFDAQKKGRKA